MRERLEKNYQLNLKNNNFQKTFIIDSFIGEGASCLVYDAKYIDELGIIRNVRIKELYPLECKEARNNHHIIWPSEDRKNYYIPQFENLYSRQIRFQNMANITNSSSQIIDDIYEANNTKYIILDCAYGKTFDKYQPNHLQNIFEVILSLTKLVKKYHDQGYLMLDIKPENFLTIDETNQLIKYLDFDSILSLYIIKNNMTDLSCSLKYAAPELLRGDVSKIDKCSDIYSIGAILYKKIFDLDVTSNERSIGFNPNYDNKYFTNINPKIYKKLTTFFRKTLCNNSKRRYQDCDEMILDLEELIEISNPNSCILLSSNIIQKNYFVGRNNECLKIDQVFKNGKNLLFINGYGGIGKTEFAKYYANSRKKDYHTIIFGKCTNGLKEVFENEDVFTIKNLRKDDISLEERIKTIKQLVDEETLVVIDNLDVLNDPYFETLCSFNCKLLITTRANLDGIISETDTTGIIQMKPLAIDDAYDLFIHYYQRNITEEEKQAIYELIKHIEGFTLMIPILAKQMMLESIVPSTMLNKLKNNKLKGISTSLIKHYKDNNIINATAYDQALGLFDIFELSNDEKEVLYIMSLLGNVSISKRTLALFAGQFDTKLFDSNIILKDFVGEIDKLKETVNVRSINSLIEKGYLDYDSGYDLVRCHNIIRELSLYEFNLSMTNTKVFKDIFEAILERLRIDFIIRKNTFGGIAINKCLDEVYSNELKQLCFNVFNNLDLQNQVNQDYVIEKIIKHIIVSGKDFNNNVEKIIKRLDNHPSYQYILSMSKLLQAIRDNESSIEISRLLILVKDNLSQNIEVRLSQLSLFFEEILKYYKIDSYTSSYILGFIEMLYLEYKNGLENNMNENLIDSDFVYKELSKKSKLLPTLELFSNGSEVQGPKIELKPKKKENINFMNIYDRFDLLLSGKNHKDDKRFRNVRSLIRKGICEYDLEPISVDEDALEKSENELEFTLFLVFLGRGIYSIFDYCKNEDIFEYFVRENDYMFLNLQLALLEDFSRECKLNAHNYLYTNYRIDTSVGRILACLGEPSILLEILRLHCETVITKDNLKETNVFNFVDVYFNTTNYATNRFYNNCIYFGKKYGDYELIKLVNNSKRNILKNDIIYVNPELREKTTLNSKLMWERIKDLFVRINSCESSEYPSLRDEILTDKNISDFFKIKLMNSFNPKITMFDALLITNPRKSYSCDYNHLESLLLKEKNSSLKGLEELVNLTEISFQYNLLNNEKKVAEYNSKIIKYIHANREYNGKFNYFVFTAVCLLIFASYHINHYEYYSDLIDFMLCEWLSEYIDEFDHYMVALVNKNVYDLFRISNKYNELEDRFTSKVYKVRLIPLKNNT